MISGSVLASKKIIFPKDVNHMADTPKNDATSTETKKHLTPLEMVRATKKRQRDTLKAGSRNESIKDTSYEDNRQDKGDNPSSSNPRFQPSRELG